MTDPNAAPTNAPAQVPPHVSMPIRLNIYLPQELSESIDRRLLQKRSENPGVARADVVRELLVLGLKETARIRGEAP